MSGEWKIVVYAAKVKTDYQLTRYTISLFFASKKAKIVKNSAKTK